jgi:hypothetical protein
VSYVSVSILCIENSNLLELFSLIGCVKSSHPNPSLFVSGTNLGIFSFPLRLCIFRARRNICQRCYAIAIYHHPFDSGVLQWSEKYFHPSVYSLILYPSLLSLAHVVVYVQRVCSLLFNLLDFPMTSRSRLIIQRVNYVYFFSLSFLIFLKHYAQKIS